MVKRIRLSVTGRVQGVGYRWFVQHRAKEYSITGYAKNMTDGSVEIEAEGEEVSLNEFKRRLTNGPAQSHIEQVQEMGEIELKHDRDFVTL